MTGLVWKDMLVSAKTAKSYGLIILFYLGLAFFDVFDISFVTAFVSVMLIMLPLVAFSYDEAAKWDGYAVSLPLGRRRVVAARYLFTLLIVLVSLAVATLFSAFIALQGQSFLEPLSSALGTLGFGLFVLDVLLPLCYKLGPERARPYLYAVIFVPIIAMFVAFRIGWRLDLSWLDALAARSELLVFALLALLPLSGAVLMLPSYLLSCRILDGKEF